MKCKKCGHELSENCLFCPTCGASVKEPTDKKQRGNGKNRFHNMINHLGGVTGETGKVELHLKNLFSGVFKKHTAEERDELFAVGTKYITPSASPTSDELPKPWLYSRVFLMLAASFVILWFILDNFSNLNAYPGFIFLGALTVPISLLVLFWEINAPKNVSFATVITVFFVGGAASLLVALILFEVIDVSDQMTYFDAIIVGIVEETAKACIVLFFLRKNNYNYLLNGLLIGAAVGAGFSVFETAGYIFRYSLAFVEVNSYVYLTISLENAISLTFLRGILSIGGHSVWAALEGVGVVCSRKKGKNVFSALSGKGFWILFLIPVVLHAIWDMPIPFGSEICLVQILLTVAAWIVVLTMIGAGFNQFKRIKTEAAYGESSSQIDA